MVTAYVTCVQAEHQYTLRELSGVKASLQRRNNDLHDLESRLQDQEAAACECLPVFPVSFRHLLEGDEFRCLAACTPGQVCMIFPDFSAGQIIVILPGMCCCFHASCPRPH